MNRMPATVYHQVAVMLRVTLTAVVSLLEPPVEGPVQTRIG
ncbi:hypothetical protein OVN18_00020 [Microcella daejeonensis]|uniref:Uncharacterized protein n=1 Tax=Microcella daejeonensis TaxID=2994971 RepID=A0A9E8S9G0_9MICO|nr:hypothetical protein [Microcella daejeonensis]WAB81456.1 hypothetical protein OVN18_00020 [Microcella daejeonensis]